jgi:predicted phosphohydrolase
MFDDILDILTKKEANDEEVEKVYEDFWRDILEKDGILDMQQLKKELFDFWNVMQNVPKVYDHVTGGKVSKILTDPKVVCDLADELFSGDLHKLNYDEFANESFVSEEE